MLVVLATTNETRVKREIHTYSSNNQQQTRRELREKYIHTVVIITSSHVKVGGREFRWDVCRDLIFFISLFYFAGLVFFKYYGSLSQLAAGWCNVHRYPLSIYT